MLLFYPPSHIYELIEFPYSKCMICYEVLERIRIGTNFKNAKQSPSLENLLIENPQIYLQLES